MKIYTKTGDTGTTALHGGTRVAKNDPRVRAYGTIDELNAHLGYIVTLLQKTDHSSTTRTALERIQSDLFTCGSHVATPPQHTRAQETLPQITLAHVTRLEKEIDTMEENLPALTQFILPGGTTESAQMHIARTVCRRAERALTEIDDINPLIFAYFNRLSDWLFVCARYINHSFQVADNLWNAER